ncbi:hypothetical protein N5U55_11715 [Aliarcobacter butzleri]|nr:hypothetical protein [Aliarcobacter butzleri]
MFHDHFSWSLNYTHFFYYSNLEQDVNLSMELFVKILEQIIESQEIVKRNKDLEQIIHMLRVYTKKQLGFMCES